MNKTTLDLARRIERSLAKGYALYLESCEADRAKGFRPHYCEHGTSNWTDYDNICGPCEDGCTMGDGVQRREYAIAEAKRKEKAIEELITASNVLYRHGIEDAYGPIWKRVTQIVDSADNYC